MPESRQRAWQPPFQSGARLLAVLRKYTCYVQFLLKKLKKSIAIK
jgi:hypothetical protein